jgi:hypothetical protein
MTPQDVITEVRRLVQDEESPYRYSDTTLLGYVNQTLKRMAVLRPDLFSLITTIPTTPNTVVQPGRLRSSCRNLSSCGRNCRYRSFEGYPRSVVSGVGKRTGGSTGQLRPTCEEP